MAFKSEKIKNEKGVTLIITFFVMVIVLAIVLGISAIIYSEIRIIRNMGASVISFYSADSGIEKILYYDRIIVPNKASRGLCSLCQSTFNAEDNPNVCCDPDEVSCSGDASVFCKNCRLGRLDENGKFIEDSLRPGCEMGSCNDCVVAFSTRPGNRGSGDYFDYDIIAKVYESGGSPSLEVKSTGFFNPSFQSYGVFETTSRAININISDSAESLPSVTPPGGGSLIGDTTPPVPYSFNPSSGSLIEDSAPAITFLLDENGDCRASLFDRSYEDMENSNDIDCIGDKTTNITCQMDDLGPDGFKEIYISCQDEFLNRNTADDNTAINYILAVPSDVIPEPPPPPLDQSTGPLITDYYAIFTSKGKITVYSTVTDPDGVESVISFIQDPQGGIVQMTLTSMGDDIYSHPWNGAEVGVDYFISVVATDNFGNSSTVEGIQIIYQ